MKNKIEYHFFPLQTKRLKMIETWFPCLSRPCGINVIYFEDHATSVLSKAKKVFVFCVNEKEVMDFKVLSFSCNWKVI